MSGRSAPKGDDYRRGAAACEGTEALVDRLAGSMELFLDRWALNMREAGYLLHTTAKRDDCIEAFRGILEPLRQLTESGEAPPFSVLLRWRGLWDFVVAEAERHRVRGITAEMFLGCLKTLLHAVESLVAEAPLPAEQRLGELLALRRAFDAMEVACVKVWGRMGSNEAIERLQETNRRLTLEKNRFENIFDGTRDLVLVSDAKGRIVEANREAVRYFDPEKIVGRSFWQVLELHGDNLEDVLWAYPAEASHEVSLGAGRSVFQMRIVPFSRVSLAAREVMVILSDVTCLAGYRQDLETRVRQRTQALADSERLFRSIFEAAGDGVLLVDGGGRVVKANRRAGEIYETPAEHLVGAHLVHLAHADARGSLEQCINALGGGRIRSTEITGRRSDGTWFSAQVTVNRLAIDGEDFHLFLVRDISEQKALADRLRQEKTQTEEMNVTLRNVLKSIDQDRRESERTIEERVRLDLIPALDKLAREDSRLARMRWAEVLEDRLASLTRGFEGQFDPRFLKLSKTEMVVCEHIRSGRSTKEIGEAMHLAFETVQTHRKSIRRKLGLRGRDVNLYFFLRERSPSAALTNGPGAAPQEG